MRLFTTFSFFYILRIYTAYIYILFGCFFFTRRTETQFIFSLLAIRFPRAVARNFFRFIFIRFFFCFAGPSPGQAKEMRDLFADRHLEHLFSLSAILFFFLFLLAARSLLLFHCAPIAGHGESRTCVKRSPDFCNGTRSSRELSKSADAENEISSTAMEIELDRIRHTIESSHFHST